MNLLYNFQEIQYFMEKQNILEYVFHIVREKVVAGLIVDMFRVKVEEEC